MPRTKRGLAAFATLLGIAAAAIAGCGGSGSSSTPSLSQPTSQTAGSAYVRLLNGSPDASGGGVITVDGPAGQLIGTVPYMQISPYATFQAGLRMAVTVHSPSWQHLLTCTTPYAFAVGGSYTVVVAGQDTGTGNQGLQCQLFAEPYALPSPGSGQVIFHHASPTAFFNNQPTLQFGTFTPGSPSPPALSPPLGTVTFVTTLTLGTAAAVPFATMIPASSAGGIGFYINASPTPSPASPPGQTPTPTPTPIPGATATPTPTMTPEVTVLPMNAQLATGANLPQNSGALPDPSNTFPLGTSTTFSIYVIDVKQGSTPPFTAIGVID